jgi:hypothetical protein
MDNVFTDDEDDKVIDSSRLLSGEDHIDGSFSHLPESDGDPGWPCRVPAVLLPTPEPLSSPASRAEPACSPAPRA